MEPGFSLYEDLISSQSNGTISFDTWIYHLDENVDSGQKPADLDPHQFTINSFAEKRENDISQLSRDFFLRLTFFFCFVS